MVGELSVNAQVVSELYCEILTSIYLRRGFPGSSVKDKLGASGVLAPDYTEPNPLPVAPKSISLPQQPPY